jgi:hypothetical protein
VYGSVEVEGYSGGKIVIEANKNVRAKNQNDLEKGKSETGIRVVEKDDRIFVIMDSPYSEFNEATERFRHNENNSRRKYQYEIDIKIKVPKNTSLDLNAMNNGSVKAKNIEAKTIEANNLNGPISLVNISGETHANALNKDIDISYKSNPTGNSSYNSLNGDITINCADALNADIYFKSLNGDFYTNYEAVRVNALSTKKESNSSRGVKYKINANERFTIGNGGVVLDFNVLNGDVFVKQNGAE